MNSEVQTHSISVVICARNEEHTIENCLKSINAQIHLKSIIQVILVNDHSEDQTVERALGVTQQLENISLTILNLKDETGKKAALNQALEQVDSEFIFITDADCEVGQQVVSLMMQSLRNSEAIVFFGPILYKSEGLWSEILSLENINTQCVTEAFLTQGNPIMANAGNMMLKKSSIEKFKSTLSQSTVSGDDVFFVQSLSSSQYLFDYHKSTAVYTQPENSLQTLWNQRIRWASKTTHYKSFAAILFSSLIFMLSMLTLYVQIYFLWNLVIGFLAIFTLSKWVMEFAFHRHWAIKFGGKINFFSSMLLSVIYPTYVCFIGIYSLLGVGYEWKGRKHKR